MLQEEVTALFLAAQNGCLPVVEALLGAGAAVDKPNADGVCPLFIASHNGHATVIARLLAAGADANRTIPVRHMLDCVVVAAVAAAGD